MTEESTANAAEKFPYDSLASDPRATAGDALSACSRLSSVPVMTARTLLVGLARRLRAADRQLVT